MPITQKEDCQERSNSDPLMIVQKCRKSLKLFSTNDFALFRKLFQTEQFEKEVVKQAEVSQACKNYDESDPPAPTPAIIMF
jgi:hypothetical protein